MKKCAKCGKEFSNHVRIDGKKHNISKRKYCIECSPFGKHNTRPITETRTEMKQDSTKRCSMCKKILPIDDFYFKNSKKTCRSCYCKKCWCIITHRQQRKFKQKLVDYKGGKCSICGYDKCIAALDFHHINPNEKDPDFRKIRNHTYLSEEIKQELDKCVLLCANCHRELHAGVIKI